MCEFAAACGRWSGNSGSGERTRIANLIARGIPRAFAVLVGASRKGPWRMSHGEVGCVCGAGTLFRVTRSSHSLDFSRLISRTAEYGPVRSVVWEGGCREAPPYPD